MPRRFDLGGAAPAVWAHDQAGGPQGPCTGTGQMKVVLYQLAPAEPAMCAYPTHVRYFPENEHGSARS
jgi:hypothetical protein